MNSSPLTVGDTFNRLPEAVEAFRASNEQALAPALFFGDEQVPAQLVNGRFGRVWRLDSPIGSRTFIPYDDSHITERIDGAAYGRSRVQVEHGLTQKLVQVPAQIVKRSSASNFAVWYTVIRG